MLNGVFMFCEFTFLVRPPPIRVWRDHRRLTVSALADQASISQAYLSQIESGRREGKASVLLALSKALGVAVEDLMVPSRQK